MRLVTGIAGNAAGVLSRVHLREVFGASGAGPMAAFAESRHLGLAGIDGRIVGMLGERTVAGFAVDVGVHPRGFGLRDIGMAGFAGLMTGEVEGFGRDFCDGCAAVVPVLSEAVRDDRGANDYEGQRAGEIDSGQTEEMSRIPKDTHEDSFLQRGPRGTAAEAVLTASILWESFIRDLESGLYVLQITSVGGGGEARYKIPGTKAAVRRA